MAKYKYERLGVMIDVSRNAVMSVEGLKTYFQWLAKMGYNSVWLYTEDVYEVEGEPYFGYQRGRYSVKEMRELDDYAYSLGIELIPCIQTLAHLDSHVVWGKVPVDSGDTLLVGEERTYEFIDNLLKSVKKCFRTNYVHIGMDEAMNLGRGKYMNKHGLREPIEIFKEHFLRVYDMVKAHGLRPIMWSDMIFRSIGESDYYMPKREMPKECTEWVPEDVIPVYWDYDGDTEETYDAMFYNHAQIAPETWFAGAAWTYRGFLPDNRHSIKNTTAAIASCRKNNIKNIYMTMWANDGGECSRYAVLPTLFLAAEHARGNTDEQKIKAKFKRTFGLEFDEFMLLDEINATFRGFTTHHTGPKAALYNDVFLGYLDTRVIEGYADHIAATAEKLHAVAKKSRKWHFLFDSAAKLLDVLMLKYDLGVRTRAAYKAGDKQELVRLAKGDYEQVCRRIAVFHKAFEKQWMNENKTIGFEVHEHRLGGTLTRVRSCQRRLLDYAAGKLPYIEELDTELLEAPMRPCFNFIRVYTCGKIKE